MNFRNGILTIVGGSLLVLTGGCAMSPADAPQAAAAGDIYYDTGASVWRAPDGGVCNTCTSENGFPEPDVQDGFYYDRDAGAWRDGRDGSVCNTCTPENGFDNPS